MKPFVVAITGGTASGKGTFAKMLAEKFPNQVSVVSMDMYYKDQGHLPLAKRFVQNMDCPEAFDTSLLVSHVKNLIAGESIKQPVYDFATHTRSPKSKVLNPKSLVIVEGLLVLHDKRLRKMCNLKIYLEAAADLRLARRLLRDLKEKRYETPEASIRQYLTSARPNHKIYITPQREKADIIVDWNKINTEALGRVEKVIKERHPRISPDKYP